MACKRSGVQIPSAPPQVSGLPGARPNLDSRSRAADSQQPAWTWPEEGDNTGIGAAPPWLRQAREIIVEHFSETLKLTQIAAEVGVHPVYLATAFRQKFGVTVGEFVRQLRIEHACAELIKGDLPLAAIALQAGFADQSHFSKVFKLYVGMTPHKYRNIVRSS